MPGSNIAHLCTQRRTDTRAPPTPHEMPVPAKQLNALQLPLYTWGGANNPPNSSPTASASAVAAIVQNAPRVWVELHRQARAELNAILSRRRQPGSTRARLLEKTTAVAPERPPA